MLGGTSRWDLLGARPAGDLRDLKAFVREVGKVGIPLLFLEPGGRDPIDLRSKQAVKADDEAAQEAAKAAGDDRWASVRTLAGVDIATDDVTRLVRYATKAEKEHPDSSPNLATPVGHGLLVIQANRAAGVAAFRDAYERITGRGISPTVLLPDERTRGGSLESEGGAQFFFQLPDGYTPPESVSTFATGSGRTRWSVVPSGSYVVIPPSVTAAGPYRWVGAVQEAPAVFLEVLEGRRALPPAPVDWSVIGDREPGDLSDLKILVHQLGSAGVPLIFLEPNGKEPIDLRSLAQRNADDLDAQQAAKAACNPRWAEVKTRAGLQLATTDVERLESYAARAEEMMGGRVPNLATVPVNGLLIVDADHAEGVQAFCEAYQAATGQEIRPTVLTPGVQNADGTWKHRGGGHFYFVLPEGYELPESVRSFAVGEGKFQWSIFPLEHYVLIPPSVRAEGPYIWNGEVLPAPAFLLEHVEADAKTRAEAQALRAERAENRSGPTGIDTWAAGVAWSTLLEQDDWFITGCRTACGCPEATAPGVHASSKSATAHEPGCLELDTSSGHGPLHVWTDNPPPGIAAYTRATGSSTLTKLQYVAWTRFDGDESRAIKALGIVGGTVFGAAASELRAAAGLSGSASSVSEAPLNDFQAAASNRRLGAVPPDEDEDEDEYDEITADANVDEVTKRLHAVLPPDRSFDPNDKAVYPAGFHSDPDLLREIFDFSDITRTIFHTARTRKPRAVHPVPLLLSEMLRRGNRCPVNVRLWPSTPLSTYVVIAGRSGLGKSESTKPDASPWQKLRAPYFLEQAAVKKRKVSHDDLATYLDQHPDATVVTPPQTEGDNSSGAGKKSPIATPSAPILEPYNFDATTSLGSGQVFADHVIEVMGKGEDAAVVMKPHPCANISEDEMTIMLRASKNESSTLISTLNSAWAGAEVGNSTRGHGDRRTSGPYSVFLTAGLQPKLGRELFCHDDSGFLQRFVFVATADTYALINEPNIPVPTTPPSGAMPTINQGDKFTADSRVMTAVETPGVDYQLDHLGDEYAEKMSHAMQVRIRLACLGALLHGTLHVTWDMWEWTGRIMEHSHRVFMWMEGQAKAADNAEARQAGEQLAIRNATAKSSTELHVERVSLRLLRAFDSEPRRTRKQLRRYLGGKKNKAGENPDRDVWFPLAFDRLVATGAIRLMDDGYYERAR